MSAPASPESPRPQHGPEFDWPRSIVASVVAAAIFGVIARAAQNASAAPQVFLLMVACGLVGAGVAWARPPKLLRAIFGSFALIVAALVAPGVGRPQPGTESAANGTPPATPTSTTTTTTTTTVAPPGSSTTMPAPTTVTSAVPGETALDESDDVVLTTTGYCGRAYGWESTELTIDGETYVRGAHQVGGSCTTSEGYILATATYVLGKRFNRFVARVGVLDNAPPIDPVRIELAIDDADAFHDRREVRVGEPWDVDLPATDIVRVTFRIYLHDGLPGGPLIGVAGGRGFS